MEISPTKEAQREKLRASVIENSSKIQNSRFKATGQPLYDLDITPTKGSSGGITNNNGRNRALEDEPNPQKYHGYVADIVESNATRAFVSRH